MVNRADAVTAATAPLAHQLRRRGGESPCLPSHERLRPHARGRGFRRARHVRPAASLVYTGTGGLDGKDPRPFLRALQVALAEQPELSEKLEVVFAGNFTGPEIAAMDAAPLRGVVRTLGHVPHLRALGLQQAADGLLLITSVQKSHVATSKIYEYLAARKPHPRPRRPKCSGHAPGRRRSAYPGSSGGRRPDPRGSAHISRVGGWCAASRSSQISISSPSPSPTSHNGSPTSSSRSGPSSR